jgi:hypothetical protein
MYTMGCYLTIKENEIMSLVGNWLELEDCGGMRRYWEVNRMEACDI